MIEEYKEMLDRAKDDLFYIEEALDKEPFGTSKCSYLIAQINDIKMDIGHLEYLIAKEEENETN